MKGRPPKRSPDHSEQEPADKPYCIAFTWAPKVQRNDPQEGYKLHLPQLRRLAQCCSRVMINPEFFHSGGLHYHAQLVILDKIKWYRSVLPSFNDTGFTKVKAYPDDGWLKYMGKDWPTVKEVLALDKPLDLMILKTRHKVKYNIPNSHIRDGIEDFIKEEIKTPSSYSETDTTDTLQI